MMEHKNITLSMIPTLNITKNWIFVMRHKYKVGGAN